eukprot:349914-Chlamydomonas_euryale.AAC.1
MSLSAERSGPGASAPAAATCSSDALIFDMRCSTAPIVAVEPPTVPSRMLLPSADAAPPLPPPPLPPPLALLLLIPRRGARLEAGGRGSCSRPAADAAGEDRRDATSCAIEAWQGAAAAVATAAVPDRPPRSAAEPAAEPPPTPPSARLASRRSADVIAGDTAPTGAARYAPARGRGGGGGAWGWLAVAGWWCRETLDGVWAFKIPLPPAPLSSL